MITFQGRIGRGRFALFAALCWIALQVTALLGSVPAYVLFASSKGDTVPNQLAAALPHDLAIVIYILVLSIITLIMIVALSLGVRRCHDYNLSGWLAFAFFAILVLLPQQSMNDYLPDLQELVWYAILVALPSSRGANKYGGQTTTYTD